MNRIILIGNGFDLAHGLKTSYADFIEWYWTSRIMGLRGLLSHISNDGLCSLKLKNEMDVWNVWAYNCISPYSKIDGKAIVEEIRKDTRNFSVESTPLFREICYKIDTKGWADIEEIYYKHLTRQYQGARPPKDVNDEFDKIRKELIEYLTEIQNGITDDVTMPGIRREIFKPFSKEDIAIGAMDQWNEMLKDRLNYRGNEWEHLVVAYNEIYESRGYYADFIERFCKEHSDVSQLRELDYINELCPGFLLPDNILLLNFNYTNTADLYLPEADKFQVNHIHGSLSHPQSVIFGYGDEHDDEYQPLMKKNDNEYLRHIKSFRYLEAANYRKMLSFIEMDTYQVCIMGHSCGVSDRTLLKKLFEHKNCGSIKPYYHQKKDGTDDYWDIVCNISRNISDPSLMRDRVVIKEHCEPLSQLSQNTQNR